MGFDTLTSYPNGVRSMGMPTAGMAGNMPGLNTYLFVDAEHGSDGNSGDFAGASGAYASLQTAIDRVNSQSLVGAVIWVASGTYAEEITISRPTFNGGSLSLTIVGAGPRGSVAVEAQTTNSTAFTNHADDVTLVNIGCAGDGSGNGLTNTGSRLRAYGSKFEGDTGAAIQLTLGTVAQEAAGTRGVGADTLFVDCETAWSSTGVLLTCTDYGAVTEAFFSGCYHHDHSAASFDESVGSGGSAAVLFQGLRINNGVFNDLEDGTAPTAFVLLNDDNANSGIVTQCAFPTAINGGKNIVSTALHWVCNYHTGGVSGAQPS